MIFGPPSPLCLCRRCLRRFADLRKKHALDFSNTYIVNLIDFHWFYAIFWPPSPLCLCRRCLRRFADLRKKHVLDFVSMYFMCFVIFKRFQCPLINKIQIWPIWSNDYARKTRIEMQCKKTCSTAPNLLSKSHLLNNSCEYRTFARMSTWAIRLINIHAQPD